MNKKILVVIIVVVLIIIGVVVAITRNTSKTEIEQESEQVENEEKVEIVEEAFEITYQGVNVTPGTAFSEDTIDEEAAVSEIPSCAFEGNDNVYTYEAVEITAAYVDEIETVYSVYFLDETMETAEGIKISDEAEKVYEEYGTDYEESGNKITYTRGNVMLSFIIENDVVTSIEYTCDFE